MLRLMLIILLGVLTLTISAQDSLSEQSYRLRQPTAEEYANIIPQIEAAWYADLNLLNTKVGNRTLIREINDSIQATYPDLYKIDVVTLEQIYNSLNNILYSELDSFNWMIALAVAYIQQNHINLSQVDDIEIYDFVVQVSHYDYDGDGNLDTLLEIQRDFLSSVYIIMDKTGKIVELPLPRFCECDTWIRGGTVTLDMVDDINNDGNIEWIFSITYDDKIVTDGQFIILQWGGDEFIQVSSSDMRYTYNHYWREPISNKVELSFDDVNSDDYIDIVTGEVRLDTWNCENYSATEFVWNAQTNQYELFDHQVEFVDSANCALRQGQSAMWDHDYEGAIPFFERALALYDVSPDVPQQAYAGVRLALAYIMTSQSEKAKEVIVNLPYTDEEPIEELVSVARVLGGNSKPLEFCLAIYNVFDKYHNSMSRPYPFWGVTYEYHFSYTTLGVADPNPNTNRAGCDIQYHFQFLLLVMEFYSSLKPVPTPQYAPTQSSSEEISPREQYVKLIDQYRQALDYEQQGELHKALTNYVTLYTQAPDTAWGMLAGLHIEPIGE